MRLIARQDQHAFAELLTRYLSKTLLFIKRYIVSHAQAEDIGQEVFIRVWQHAGKWQDQSVSAKSWIFRIAYNLCIDELRKSRQQTDSTDELENNMTPETQYIQSQQTSMVNNAIAALPERQRSALWLCAYEGLSNKEAAAALDISVQALESLLSRARRKLKEQLTV